MQKTALLLAFLFTAISVMGQIKTQVPTGVKNKPVLTTRVVTDPQTDSTFAMDVAASYDKMEQNVEIAFAKLKKDIREDIARLNEQMKQLPAKLAPLQKQMNKLQAELAKIDQLAARFMTMMDSIKASPGGGLLNGDRVKMQHRMDSLSTQRISMQDQINDLQGRINVQTALNNDEKKNLQKQIAMLEQEMADLDKQKQAMITAIRQQKQKALAQLAKEKVANPQRYQSVISEIVTNDLNLIEESLQRIGRRTGVVR